MTCDFSDLELESLGSIKVKVRSANQKPIDGLISDLLCVQHCMPHYFEIHNIEQWLFMVTLSVRISKVKSTRPSTD